MMVKKDSKRGRIGTRKCSSILFILALAALNLVVMRSPISQLKLNTTIVSNKTSTAIHTSRSQNQLSSAEKDLETSDSDNHKTELRPSCYKSSILPKRIYTVVGLESSGTTFTAEVIKNGLNIRKRREGHLLYRHDSQDKIVINDKTVIDFDMEQEDIQTQHFSLPWGSSCSEREGEETPIVDVVLPTQCSRDHNEEEVQRCCNDMANDLFGFRPNGKRVKYPPRYNLDIVSHKEWYDRYGVDQWMVIVLRDHDISIAARSRSHCADKERLLEEQQAGRDIIIDAINKYILGEDERKVTRETYKFWYAKNFQNQDGVRGGGRRLQAMTSLPSKNRVVLVSYESMMELGQVYIKMLYDTLGIETDFVPEVRNGNSKYVVDK